MTSETNADAALIQPEVQSVAESTEFSIDELEVSALSNLIENIDNHNELVCILSTLAGVKRGFSYVDWVEPSLENPDTHWLPTYLERLDVGYQAELLTETPLEKNQLVVLGSQYDAALESLPEVSEYSDFNEYSETHLTTLGKFLGVPEEDCGWFEEKDSPNVEESVPITGAINWRPEVRYARLVSWVCRPTNEGLSRTITKGRQFHAACVKASQHTGLEKPIKASISQLQKEGHCWYPGPFTGE